MEQIPVSVLALKFFLNFCREFPQHIQVGVEAIPQIRPKLQSHHGLRCENSDLLKIFLQMTNIRMMGYLYTSPPSSFLILVSILPPYTIPFRFSIPLHVFLVRDRFRFVAHFVYLFFLFIHVKPSTEGQSCDWRPNSLNKKRFESV
jgi:hypothetical protein